MTERILALVAANVLLVVLGAGLLPLLRLAQTRRELLTRLPLGYAVGLAAGGILVADLSLAARAGRADRAAAARGGLARARAAAAARGAPRRARAAAAPTDVAALAVLGVAAAFVVPAARLFAVKPLLESDGWVIWATRARALFEFGHPVAPVFTDPSFPALQYPLLLPAPRGGRLPLHGRVRRHARAPAAARARDRVRRRRVGAAARARAARCCSRRRCSRSSPRRRSSSSCQTNFADIPLAMSIALGVAALAAWLRTGAPGLLPAAALFLGAGALTKNEGELFALAAFVAALARRTRAAAAAARVGGAGDVRDRPAVADLGAGARR